MADSSTENGDPQHHVVVVGGGFGGLQCIKSLRRAGVRITLIDQRNHHLFQPLLYQAATTVLAPSEIAWPLRQVVRDRAEVTTLMARVTGVDAAEKTVQLDDGKALTYDTLVLATGARHSYFGRDEWEAHAPGLKTLEDAIEIRRRILSAFEAAERSSDPDERAALLTFAVIGAGPTGVELAGIIAELSRRILPRDFRRVDTAKARVLLIEAGQGVLPAFPSDLSGYAAQVLERLGVEVRLGTPVSDCRADAVALGEEEIPCRTILWAAGVQASAAAGWMGAETDRAGRAIVGADLSLPGQEDVFVIGDTALVRDAKGARVPGIAPAAKQMGAYVAAVIAARQNGGAPPAPFAYRHMGSMATLGRRAAIADFGRFRMKGMLAWWMWGIVHILFLIGARSRISVALSWFWSYLTAKNTARIITEPKHPAQDG